MEISDEEGFLSLHWRFLLRFLTDMDASEILTGIFTFLGLWCLERSTTLFSDFAAVDRMVFVCDKRMEMAVGEGSSCHVSLRSSRAGLIRLA